MGRTTETHTTCLPIIQVFSCVVSADSFPFGPFDSGSVDVDLRYDS